MAKKVQKKKKGRAQPKVPETQPKDFLDLIAPAAVKFNTDHYTCGSMYRCTLALRSYPTTTEELALLRRLWEKSGVTLSVYARQVTAAALVKAALAALTDEGTRKKLGWVLAAILSPVIVTLALILSLLSGAAQQNVSSVELCFRGGTIPANASEEYRTAVLETRDSFTALDGIIAEINDLFEDDQSLDTNWVKAVFYVLYFGGQQPDAEGLRSFVDCFVTYTEGTRTVTEINDTGQEVEVEEEYQIPHLVEDLAQIYRQIGQSVGVSLTAEQQVNADRVYNLIVYGGPDGDAGGTFPGAGVPFIGADGFCSPIGAGWESVVTSEFGYRRDPFTGETRGHTGMDLGVPTGTPIRAALGGTVTVSQYNSSYGYYVMIDHGDGLATLYAHNSQLLAQMGQTVEAGDIIARSGSTGRSTGPHLHFEVRVNGQRTDPRYYLPTTGG